MPFLRDVTAAYLIHDLISFKLGGTTVTCVHVQQLTGHRCMYVDGYDTLETDKTAVLLPVAVVTCSSWQMQLQGRKYFFLLGSGTNLLGKNNNN